MFETILVPLDGSELSERALPYAAALAHRAKARLLLLRAVLAVRPTGPEAERFNDRMTGEAEEELARAAGSVVKETGSVERLVADEAAGPAILEAVAEREADLIVMSTHGRTGLGRFVFGSVADRVLQTSPVPVLLVPAATRADWAAAVPFRIVVPLDGSPLAEEALAPAARLAQAMGGELVLVQAAEWPTYLAPADGFIDVDASGALSEARRYLTDLAESSADLNVGVSVHVARGAASQVIADAVRNYGAQVVAMATHGRSGLTRALLGSVAQDVLRTATVPLLLTRPSAVQARDEEAEVGGEHPLQHRPGEAPLVAVLMSQEELDLVRLALGSMLIGPAADEQTGQAARALLERLSSTLDRARLAAAG